VNTVLGRIAKAIAEAKEEKTPLEVELGYFGKRIGIIILAIVAMVFFMRASRVNVPDRVVYNRRSSCCGSRLRGHTSRGYCCASHWNLSHG